MAKEFSYIGEKGMLHLLFTILSLIVFGGCQMQETTAQKTDDAQKIVLEHAAKNYSLSATDIKISDATPKDFFPDTKQFYVEENESQHRNYNYLVYKNQAYSSGTDGELKRFLKDYDFVKKTNDAEKYLTLFRIFSLPKDINVIDGEFVKNYQTELQKFPKVQAPKLTKNADGSAEVVFYVTPVTPLSPEKWTARISANSDIQIGK